MSEGESLSQLMAAVQRGDERAYERLLRRIQPIIYGYLRRRLRSNESAEDVSQNVLLTVHRVRHTYDPLRPFEPWLFSIARSRLIDHFRRIRTLTAMEVLMDVMPEASEAPVEDITPNMLEILAGIPASQRDAFLMLKIEGLSVKEAADRAGISDVALKVRAHRAYKAIKQFLSGHDDDSRS